MKSFRALNFKEKMEYIGILAIYPLILLYEQIGKSVKFLNTRKRQITASILTVCLMLTMIPVMSLTASATTTHTHDEVTFEPWTATDSLPTTSGNYYLVNDVALGKFYDIPENVDITLCLNDKVVTVTSYIYNICITSQGRLTIYDCGNTVRSYT